MIQQVGDVWLAVPEYRRRFFARTGPLWRYTDADAEMPGRPVAQVPGGRILGRVKAGDRAACSQWQEMVGNGYSPGDPVP